MELTETLRESLREFCISEEDALDVRQWVQTTDSIPALVAFYEVVGESELQIAYVLHLIEVRMKELNDS